MRFVAGEWLKNVGGIKKGTILGVPDTPKVWDMLDEQLDKEYCFASGKGLLVARAFIDSGGHYTKEVYAYCKNDLQGSVLL